MRHIQLVRLALVATVLAMRASAAGPGSFEDCLRGLRSAPPSFVNYFCLGTPGLPERPLEVRAALEQLLERSPKEPHARLYLGLMRLYRLEEVPKAEFTEPLAFFERTHAQLDTFLGRLSLLERICFATYWECAEQEPLLASAEQLATALRDPNMKRLAAIARIRWSLQVRTYSDARRAESVLNGLGPIDHAPDWLRLLDVTTRAHAASLLAEYGRARELYSQLLSSSSPGSVAHAEAVAGLARLATRMALTGLAPRSDAERLLRQTIAEQQPLELLGYDSRKAQDARTLLALLLGRTEESLQLAERGDAPLRIELWLQGTPEERARALQTSRDIANGFGQGLSWAMMLRAHAEFWAGSDEEGIAWGTRALDRLNGFRRRETEESMRLVHDSQDAGLYQVFVSDLLRTGTSDRRHLEVALERTEQLRASLLLETLLTREDPARATGDRLPTAAELAGALRPDEALVSFFFRTALPSKFAPFAGSDAWAFVVTRETLRAVRLPGLEQLEPAIRAWTGMLNDRHGLIESGSRRLYRDILKPILDGLPAGVRSLVVVPDGPIHQLPLEALSESGRTPYVAERYAISVAPSAAVWHRLRSRPVNPPGLALGFANTPEGPALAIAEHRGEIAPGQLGILLHAREEAQDAVDAFPRGSKLYTGADATPDRLASSELSRVSLVHFAAHGVVNEIEPQESFLLLAPASGGSGKLSVSDVRKVDWTGKTVILSACQTSTGAVQLAEGVLSLARGFFAGGASTVVGTLAQVRDDEQLVLFREFYRELRKGISVGEAMSAAKRTLIHAGAPPGAWANVEVLGDATVHPRAPASWRKDVHLLAAAIATALLGALAFRARRRRTARTTSG